MSGEKVTLIDFFRAFQSAAEKSRYPSSARVTFYTILNAWNDERRPDCLRIRRGTLQDSTGLSESSVRNALQFLANIGWIKLNRVHSKNAPLAVLLRIPCAPSDLMFPTLALTEKERARARTEPKRTASVAKSKLSACVAEDSRTAPTSSVLDSAKEVLKRLKVRVDVTC